MGVCQFPGGLRRYLGALPAPAVISRSLDRLFYVASGWQPEGVVKN